MRRFTAEYLEHTRRGMWEEREALAPLDLGNRERILDAGCGSGAFTRVLREESNALVYGIDADRDLLRAVVADDRVQGDATCLPFRDESFDLAVCQALLINLPRPNEAIGELVRVSSDLVAAIEPDNADVSVESTVPSEASVSRRAREAYIDGVGTDVTLGSHAADLFRHAGLDDVTTRRYRHRRTTEPPYTESAIEEAALKARGDKLADQRTTMLSGDLTADSYDALRDDWRAMGREIVTQIRADEYQREEVVPFYVTVAGV